MAAEAERRMLIVANRTASTPAMQAEVKRRSADQAALALLIPPVHGNATDWSAEGAAS